MKALRLHADPVNHARQRSANASQDFRNPRIEIEEASVPVPRANELLLKVRYCGLSSGTLGLEEAVQRCEVIASRLLSLNAEMKAMAAV